MSDRVDKIEALEAKLASAQKELAELRQKRV